MQMKFVKQRFFFIGILVIWANLSSSQNVEFYFGKPDFDNATIQLNNGQVFIGEVQDFNSPNAVEFKNDNPFEITTSATEEIEQKLNLDRKKIKFRKNKNESYRLIPADSIDVIQFFDDELNKSFEFKRLRIAKSVNGEIKDTKRSLFLPIFKKDSINLYGYNVYLNGQYASTIFYLNNPKDNFAITPYDLSFSEMLVAKKKLTQRVVTSFKFVSNNCIDFHKWLDDTYYNESDEAIKKDYKVYYNATKKEIKEGQKNLKTYAEKKDFEQQKWIEYFMRSLTPAIDKYKELCK